MQYVYELPLDWKKMVDFGQISISINRARASIRPIEANNNCCCCFCCCCCKKYVIMTLNRKIIGKVIVRVLFYSAGGGLTMDFFYRIIEL